MPWTGSPDLPRTVQPTRRMLPPRTLTQHPMNPYRFLPRICEKMCVRGVPGGALTTAQLQRTATKHQPRRIALFGGSFDPIHNGHVAVARAADRRFNFDEIHFIPASRPPHKLKAHLAPFPHRFAMVALACARSEEHTSELQSQFHLVCRL